jgi:hypothetical protein
MKQVSAFRLHSMRALYLLMFVGQGFIQFPTLLHHAHPLDVWHGIGASMLGAMALLAALGVRYPLKMLPLLLFELTWKSIWVFAIALPMRLANQMDPDTLEVAPSILLGVFVLFVIPWRYVFANYLWQTHQENS